MTYFEISFYYTWYSNIWKIVKLNLVKCVILNNKLYVYFMQKSS